MPHVVSLRLSNAKAAAHPDGVPYRELHAGHIWPGGSNAAAAAPAACTHTATVRPTHMPQLLDNHSTNALLPLLTLLLGPLQASSRAAPSATSHSG
jgi:hypothetical protein